MPVYLVENPPRVRQYRSPRRERPSGVVVVHTAESFPDEVGPDTGAENVARFIELRTNHGSYHDLVDSDSIIQMVRYSDEAFHDATGSNPHSYGVSAATQAAKWRELGDDWVDATVRNMARATARYARWVKTHYGIVIPARRITRAESENRKPGFISHAERDPDRRTDPGRHFPWGDFLGYYADEMEDDMTPEQAKQLDTIFSRVSTMFSVLNSYDDAKIQRPDADGTSGMRWALQRVWEDTHRLSSPVVAWEDGEKHTIVHTLSWLQRSNHALMSAQEGLDTAAILAKLDEVAGADAARDQAVLDAITALESGDADAALARLRDLLNAALSTDTD